MLKSFKMKNILFILIIFTNFSFSSNPFLRRNQVVEVVEKVSQSVVNISAEVVVKRQVSPFEDLFFDFFSPFSRLYKYENLGTGVITNPQGIIITNYHVIEGAKNIKITTLKGNVYNAEVLGSDENSDIAILKIKGTNINLPAATLGTSKDLMIGESVIAIGNPMGLSNTVTTGVISALKRKVKGESGTIYSDFIQTDAAINPGNSGGPLLNILGEVIGINTAIIKNAQGIGFAIPIDRAKKILKDILKYGEVKPIFIGISFEKETNVVKSVLSVSPFSSLRKGDKILMIENVEVRDKSDFYSEIFNFNEGEKISLKVSRGGEKKEFTFTLTKPPEDIGIVILKESIGILIEEVRKGLRIKKVIGDSQADRIGIDSGDYLLGINGYKTESFDDVNKIIQKNLDKDSLVLYIYHNYETYKITFEL